MCGRFILKKNYRDELKLCWYSLSGRIIRLYYKKGRHYSIHLFRAVDQMEIPTDLKVVGGTVVLHSKTVENHSFFTSYLSYLDEFEKFKQPRQNLFPFQIHKVFWKIGPRSREISHVGSALSPENQLIK